MTESADLPKRLASEPSSGQGTDGSPSWRDLWRAETERRVRPGVSWISRDGRRCRITAARTGTALLDLGDGPIETTLRGVMAFDVPPDVAEWIAMLHLLEEQAAADQRRRVVTPATACGYDRATFLRLARAGHDYPAIARSLGITVRTAAEVAHKLRRDGHAIPRPTRADSA
jgi:hypothetical protein